MSGADTGNSPGAEEGRETGPFPHLLGESGVPEGAEPTVLPSRRAWRVHTGLSTARLASRPSLSRPSLSTRPLAQGGGGASPAGVRWEVLRVVRVLLVFFEVQLGQQLAGLGHTVIHGAILQDALRSSHLPQDSNVTMQPTASRSRDATSPQGGSLAALPCSVGLRSAWRQLFSVFCFDCSDSPLPD